MHRAPFGINTLLRLIFGKRVARAKNMFLGKMRK